MLADRGYGERWATHWLGAVRFAESDGYRADDFRSTAYLYRDYVVKSLNQDKPYDQFVREQLAGDEIDPREFDHHMIATGFLRHGVYEWNQRNARMQWELILNEMTNATGEVFLDWESDAPSVMTTNSIPFSRRTTILCKVSSPAFGGRKIKTSVHLIKWPSFGEWEKKLPGP